MWVRAVAVALAVGCWAVSVQAAQYAEAWNPPETRHAAKKATPHADHKAALHAGHKTATHGKHPAKPHGKVGAKREPKKPRKLTQSNRAQVHAAAHQKGRKAAVPHAVAHSRSRMAHASAKPVVNPVATRTPTQAATSAPVQSAPAMASTTAKPAINGSDLPPILH